MITCGLAPWPSTGGCGRTAPETDYIIDADVNGDQDALCGGCGHVTPLEDPSFREGGEFYQGDEWSIYGPNGWAMVEDHRKEYERIFNREGD